LPIIVSAHRGRAVSGKFSGELRLTLAQFQMLCKRRYLGEKPTSADGKKRVITGFPELLAGGAR
jgi:hypothetical protein